DKIDALKTQARAMDSEQMGEQDSLALIRQLLSLLDGIEEKINRRLAVLRDRIGRWVFLAGPGVKKKPIEDDDAKRDKKKGKSASDKKAKQSLIQRPKPKDKPSKIKAV
ncbi:MAG: hypothetical protein QF464_09470, partial [Myxococcota bacterium]|nr:hypothetical protein [Myxococcota bacterium]